MDSDVDPRWILVGSLKETRTAASVLNAILLSPFGDSMVVLMGPCGNRMGLLSGFQNIVDGICFETAMGLTAGLW